MTGGWAATNTLREWLRRSVIPAPNEASPFLSEATDALALVETALDAAEALTGWDFAATQWIDGLTHDGHELRAIHAEDIEKLKQQVAALAAALRAVREGT